MSPPESVQHQTHIAGQAAMNLLECIQRFADTASNPVLTLLGEDTQLVTGKKYPPELLLFGGDRLTAYYHCHDTPAEFMDCRYSDYGHFHIFIKTDQTLHDSWSHLAGLSIDEMGQPTGWFAVNQWVSGRQWYPANILHNALNTLEACAPPPDNTALVQQWLFNLLVLYRDELAGMLAIRDKNLQQLREQYRQDDSALLGNREIYFLAALQLDLLHKLHSATCNQTT